MANLRIKSKNFLTNLWKIPIEPNKTKEQVSIPEIPNLLDGIVENVRDYLPPKAFKLVDEYKQTIDIQIHKIDCQLEIEAKQGQKLQCDRGKRELKYQKELQKFRDANKPKQLKSEQRTVKFKNKNRGLVNTRSNLNNTRLNQNNLIGNYRDVNVRFKINPSDSKNNFKANNPNSSLGDRAVLFDANGRVLRTANAINEDGRAIDEAAKIAADKPVRSLSTKRSPKRELRNLSDAIQKTKASGRITGLSSLFAAITGLIAVIAILALLIPMSFVTVALNWLQTVTTMFTNIKDLTTTYLSFADAGLSLFGYPKLKSKIKVTIDSIAYGMFGKENYEQAKADFAQGILNLTSLTKMLERIEAARNNTDSKIDAVALSLGTTNNALKESGMIPADSPWMEYSQNVDKFVDAQTKVSTDPNLKENIEKLTAEIKTNEEIEKELKEENEAKEKIRIQKQKEVDNLKNLGEGIKPIIERQIADAKE